METCLNGYEVASKFLDKFFQTIEIRKSWNENLCVMENVIKQLWFTTHE